MNKCCVCLKETKDIQEVKSTLNKNINTYCSYCLSHNFEPYTDLVEFGWEYRVFPKHFQRLVVFPTLSYYNKSIKEFNEDVQKKRDEKDASISQQ